MPALPHAGLLLPWNQQPAAAQGDQPLLRALPAPLQGNRDNIDGMASGTQKVLTQVLKLVDAHDLVRGARQGGVARAAARHGRK